MKNGYKGIGENRNGKKRDMSEFGNIHLIIGESAIASIRIGVLLLG